MSFYDSASLAFLPSGGAGKDGKAYSIKPRDGSGDFTFSRGSNLAATRVDVNGLIEKGRENLLLYSNDITNAAWLKASMNISSGHTSYNGSSTAFKLIPNTTSIFHRIIQSQSWAGDVRTASFYAKADGYNIIRIVTFTGATDISLAVDLSDGSIVQESGATKIATNVESVGNEWYRISLTASGSSVTSVFSFQVYVHEDAALTQNWAGDGTSGVLFADPQREFGLVATDYIESGATTGKAGILEDSPRFDFSGGASCPSLLLEPSRTNLIGYSEYFGASNWTALRSSIALSSVTSPEGKANAYKLTTDGTANNTHIIYYGGTITSNTYSLSLYAKAAEFSKIGLGTGNLTLSAKFDLSSGSVITSGAHTASIESAGNDWYRCTIVTTTTTPIRIVLLDNDGNISFDGDGTSGLYIFGHQQEEGSYPTSYIPNHSGGSVTRNFDYSIVESLGYSSTCTLYYEFNITTGREGASPFIEVGKDNSNKFYIKGSSANNPQFQVQGNGIFGGDIIPTNEVSGINKIAVQWSSGVGVAFSNGVKQSGTLTNSNTSQTIDFISAKGNGTSHHSKQLLFFPSALSDTDCEILTGTSYESFAAMATALNYTTYE
jgi:hypothetical protein